MYLSIRLKLIIAFFSIIAVGYLSIIYFFSKSETEVLKKRAIEHLEVEALYSIEHLKHHLDDIANEVLFLSKLEIMDDIIANDIDKRITKILEKKREDIGKDVTFLTLNTNGEIVASATASNFKIDLKKLFSKIENIRDKAPYIFVFNKYLVFSSPVYASFDDKLTIGTLLLFKPLKNLSDELHISNGVIAWIIPLDNLKKDIGSLFNPPDKKILLQNYLYVIKPIGPPLDGWKLGYALKKDIAFETIQQVQNILLFTFIVMLVLTSILTIIIDRRIVEPVRKLADTASKIVSTNDYTMRVKPFSKDEIGELAENFNLLMEKTAEAFNAIERQNRESVQTLIELMNFFGYMIQSETKEETIERACRELRRLTSADTVTFCPEVSDKRERCIVLESAQSFENNRKVYGAICIEGAKETMAMENRFFESASRMISLQIERIELLQTTREALKSKTSFFSALSHELRTPLGSILSLTQYLMTTSNCDESAKEVLGKIESSASHLLQIINDILTMAKAESGKLEPMFQQCDLVTLIEETIDMVMPLAEAKGIELNFYHTSSSMRIQTDPKLFRQVLINLLANAVKYTFDGKIKVTLSSFEYCVEVIVEDTGIGIEPDALKEVFNEFYREYRVRGSENGSGLGLALSKKIAQVLKGDLFIESEGEGKGTKATFKLFV
ncbi:sensor histidine kinase [Hydrogenimonas thermophila]|uniref:histidine kinase n=1 Tax=Hydrogenimonas thermophila TaxID=223786 RepID=A0A1I5MNY9_9BACT|nr:sensor histidine kinase [Hydrogenimonas thermophila]SFP11223.1 HAMP domain-containing protein [Hydrogenimonas thermophila]